MTEKLNKHLHCSVPHMNECLRIRRTRYLVKSLKLRRAGSITVWIRQWCQVLKYQST